MAPSSLFWKSITYTFPYYRNRVREPGESAGHKYMMRGQVLDVTDGSVYLCIGYREGAKVGQEYAVYRFTKVQFARPRYNKELIGRVKITELVNEHYATANILNGELKENDVVELD